MTTNIEQFIAEVDEFILESREKVEAIFKQSAQDVFEAAQRPVGAGGNMPVDTAFLRNSFVSTLNGGAPVGGADAYVATIAGAELGDRITGGWTASYAPYQEFGTSTGVPARAFARTAAAGWQSFVQANARRVAGGK